MALNTPAPIVNEKPPRMSESSIEKGHDLGTTTTIVDVAGERAYGMPNLLHFLSIHVAF